MSDNRWWLVAFAFGAGALVWSLGLFGPAAVLPYLRDVRGWSVSTVSAAATLHYLASAGVVAAMPELHRRLGLRATVLAGAAAVHLGFIAWIVSPVPAALFAAALVSGFGLACGSAATVAAIVSLGFAADRARALGIALNGTATGGVLLLPLLTAGGRHLSLPLTLVVLLVVAFALLAWLSMSLDRAIGRGGGAARPAPAMTRAALLRVPRFRSLAAAFSIAVFVQIGLYSQLINYLRPILGIDGAGFAMTGCVALAIVGRFAVAWNIGRADPRIAAAVNFLMQALGAVALALATGPGLALLGCVLFGLGLGNLPLLPPLIAQAEYDEREFGLVVASVSAINQVVLAFGPVCFGVLHDLSASYGVPFALGAGLYVVASGAILLHAVPRLRRA